VQANYLSVDKRVKTIKGALEKIARKEYSDPPTELTDLSGIRVITFLEQQVSQISAVIRELFEIDEKNSRDRSEVLGDDTVGYRSTHFVCALGKKRDGLPEYESLGNLKFEIQVRTVLQHAWAELAHDRSFKFGVALPTKIQRKLNLCAGILEVTDSAFDEISKEIDAYQALIKKQNVDQISALEINAISLEKLLAELATELGIKISENVMADAYVEMAKFGIKTIGDLKALATPEFIKNHKSIFKNSSTATGIVRRLMIYSDLDRYLALSPKFQNLIPTTYDLLAKKYDEAHLKKSLKNAGKVILPREPIQP
jgi:putative GTP pyrophosphokinase